MAEVGSFCWKGRVDMREIVLTQGKKALVDDADFDLISSFTWSAQGGNKRWYARRHAEVSPGVWHGVVYMHRMVLEAALGRPIPTKVQVDHINGDGLDNRRCNLREATSSQNIRNRVLRERGASSRFLGVAWHRRDLVWQAAIKDRGVSRHLGSYSSELEAALAREYFIAAHPELHARSNFGLEAPK